MIALPYESTGQELGETRAAMAKGLMNYLEGIIMKRQHVREKYYVLVHGKPFPGMPNIIKQKFVIIEGAKPPMMLSCLLFGVDNTEGKLTIEWALPGSWPVWSLGGENEPVPETIASINKLGIQYKMDSILSW